MIILQLQPEDLKSMIEKAVKNGIANIQPTTSPEPIDEDRLINKKEAARLLSCSTSTIDNYRREGKLKRYKVGSGVRFKRLEVLGLVENKKSA